MYYVISWQDHMVLAETPILSQAKRLARNAGYETIYGARTSTAYVAVRDADNGCYYVVYNPRFRLVGMSKGG